MQPLREDVEVVYGYVRAPSRLDACQTCPALLTKRETLASISYRGRCLPVSVKKEKKVLHSRNYGARYLNYSLALQYGTHRSTGVTNLCA